MLVKTLQSYLNMIIGGPLVEGLWPPPHSHESTGHHGSEILFFHIKTKMTGYQFLFTSL